MYTNVYFHLLDHIRICKLTTESILLDLKADKYLIIPAIESNIIQFILTVPFLNLENLYFPQGQQYLYKVDLSVLQQHITNLRQSGILNLKDFLTPYDRADFSKPSSAMMEPSWLYPLTTESKTSYILMFEALLTLIKVCGVLKFKGFYSLILSLRKFSLKVLKTTVRQPKIKIDELVSALNKASKLYFIRVKCLEWSIALTFLGRKYGLELDIVIGVQNYPFAAHAWVEHDGKVIADSSDLTKLSTILREPINEFCRNN